MQNLIKTTKNTVYRKEASYELWAHLGQNNEIMIQVVGFFSEKSCKNFGKQMAGWECQRMKMDPQHLLEVLTAAFWIEFKEGKEQLVMTVGGSIEDTKASSFSLVLPERQNSPPLINYIMIQMMEQKMGYRVDEKEDQYEPIPIHHQTQRYQFQASYVLKSKTIKTRLFINESTGGKERKQFLNNIGEQYFSKELKTAFESLEILFEHIRDENNIDIILDKGRIRIRNEPSTQQLHLLRKKISYRRQRYACGKNRKDKLPGSEAARAQQDLLNKVEKDLRAWKSKLEMVLDRRFSSQDKNMEKEEIKLSHRLKNLNGELLDKFEELSDRIDELDKDKDTSQNAKIDIEILEEWKSTMIQQMGGADKKVKGQLIDLITEAKRGLTTLIGNLRSEFDVMLRQNEGKCRASIDRLEYDFYKRVEDLHRVPPKDNVSLRSSEETSFRGQKWNPIEVDPSSQQINRFKIDLGNVIIYNGRWEWTQLFTNIVIPHGKSISLAFKVINSVHHAIAIGVSDRSNIGEKTSLSLKGTIAYWADGEVWEGMKLREEGSGYRAGETVTMKVDTERGSISWSVQNDLRACHSSSLLRDRSLHLMGYIQMYDKSDSIQFLSFKYED